MTRRTIVQAVVGVVAVVASSRPRGVHEPQHAQRHGLHRDGLAADRRSAGRRPGRPRDRRSARQVLEQPRRHQERRVVVDILDDSSNPSQAVQNVAKFIGDSKYLGILGSGNAAAAVATGQSRARRRCRSSRCRRRRTSSRRRSPTSTSYPTSRLFAYNLAGVPARARDQERLAHGRQRRLRPRRPRAGPEARRKLRARGRRHDDLLADDDGFRRRAHEDQELNAQALWLWTATPAGNTIVKQFRQLQLPQRLVLTGANVSQPLPAGDVPDANGALVNSYLGTVWKFLPKSNPGPVRKQAALVEVLLKHPISNFDVDAASSL